MLYTIKRMVDEVVTTIPTIGFNVETLEIQNSQFTCWDVGGCDKIRPLWRHYTLGSHGLVFVVDSNDHERLADLNAEMQIFFKDETLRKVPLLVLANKQDLPKALSAVQIIERLELGKVVDREW